MSRRYTPAQLSHTRNRIRDLEHQARNDALALDGARGMLRQCLLNVTRCEWDAVFHSDTDPERSAKLSNALPTYRTQVAAYYNRVRRLEETVGSNLREARDLQLLVNLHSRHYVTVEPPGLWLLLQVCIQGWRRSREA